ncbi:MAG: toll/interleukin-1 receptor domain-containing protein [Methanobrevibacter sp.]|uniref:toll/interleukin-1 receptor domain-containing protein n=1 Tax=Methanobrevibacter sp. TaxID=66852 RepID=UPI002E76B254|nr:toll/interleukin-1 receptor domain-containing protein [Methanobrevibacter sp.]MEE0943391.1 toll/interleukin-1 receptor domain-containing protein [Methanobrevibacter sp.]
MSHDVFISYSTKDKVTADAICHTLENNNMKCWIAPRNIKSGKPYAEEIMDAIMLTKIVVLVFSSNSQASQFVNNEINIAFSNSKPILSFKIDESMPEKELEYFLKTNHWLEAYPNPEEKFSTLVRDASKLIGDENKNPIVDSDVMERARKGEFNNFSSKKDWILYILLLTPLYPIITIYMGLTSKIKRITIEGVICLVPLILYLYFLVNGGIAYGLNERVICMAVILALLIINFIYALLMRDEFLLRKSVLKIMSDDEDLFDDLLDEYSRI